ncbi:hypothetical protein GCM10010309_24930 [Streptomyces violaceochromogenes]|nr:hypothetical protein GCM10010309_24930 [Streptomyces violaceochromogenes]
MPDAKRPAPESVPDPSAHQSRSLGSGLRKLTGCWSIPRLRRDPNDTPWGRVPIIRVTFRVGRRNFPCARFPLGRGLVDSGEAIPAGGPELLGQEHDVAGTPAPAGALEAPKAGGAVHTADVTAVSKHPGPWTHS